MDKKFKAFVLSLISVPFAFAFVGVLEKLHVLPFLDGWNDYILVIQLFVGGCYFFALKVFDESPSNNDPLGRRAAKASYESKDDEQKDSPEGRG
jgi:hypothetical protein